LCLLFILLVRDVARYVCTVFALVLILALSSPVCHRTLQINLLSVSKT